MACNLPTLLLQCSLLTPNKQHNKRGVRRVHQNKSPASDGITLKGKQRVTVLQTSNSPTPGSIDYNLTVSPQSLGDRVSVVSSVFARYRFNSLRFQLKAKLPVTTPGTVVMGVLDDDNSNASGTTSAQVLDYRISSERHVYADQTIRWSPLDKSKWYYTTQGGDGRFQFPCTLIISTDDVIPSSLFPIGTPVYSLDLHYSITFEGAVPNAAYGLAGDYVTLPQTPSGNSPPPIARINPQPLQLGRRV